LGIDARFSRDPRDLDSSDWDVIHTHGSSFSKRGLSRAVRVHTLHGTTLGRMAACGEWTWPGGYAAAFREWRGVQQADIVMGVHPDLWLFKKAKRLGKITEVCWNGWDSQGSQGDLGPELKKRLENLGKFWIFVGRGSDVVKGAARLQAAMPLLPDIKWIAAPGDGFETKADVLKTGTLSTSQVRELMQMASGLVIPSLYEGLPLVLLEALSEGLPVVSARVGGIKALSPDLQGLVTTDSGDPRAFADALRSAQAFESGRDARRLLNRSLLPSWSVVASHYRQALSKKELHE
jgi:glycosyltransferase involved in cell wall biosynthesis